MNTLAVQGDCDPPRRFASRELGKNPAHSAGLGFVDLTAAVDRFTICVALANDIVAKTVSAAGSALSYTALKAAPRLVGEILQEQRIHRPLQPDVKLGDLAFRKRDQADAGEAQPLEQPGNILLVA